MKTYYIYHIPGIKIGCSSEPEKRISAQGYSDYEILETYDDINVASLREIELQKQYGYRVDHILYSESILNRTHTEESKQRIGDFHRNKSVSEKTRYLMGEKMKNNTNRLGIKHTEDTIEKMKSVWTDERKKTQSDKMKIIWEKKRKEK